MSRATTVLLAGLALLGTGFLTRIFDWPTWILEAVLILAAVAPVAGPLARLFARVDLRQTLVMASLVLLIFSGQLLAENTFPFSTWRMYSQTKSTDEATAYEYSAITRSGEEIVLVPSRLLPSLTGRRLASSLTRQSRKWEKWEAASRKAELPEREEDPRLGRRRDRRMAELREKQEETLLAIGRLHDRRLPDDPLQTIVVTRKTIPLKARLQARPGAITSQVLWSFGVR